MTPSVPRPAATACVVRDGRSGIEVLLAKRSHGSPFVPGVSVFPGGGVDDKDRQAPDPFKAAAIRETFEEVGLLLADRVGTPIDPGRPLAEQRSVEDFAYDDVVYLSRWVTPERSGIRFDTRFYLAAAPVDSALSIDDRELISADWFEPALALRSWVGGELQMVSPTVAHLRYLDHYGTVDVALEGAILGRFAAEIDQEADIGRRQAGPA